MESAGLPQVRNNVVNSDESATQSFPTALFAGARKYPVG